MTLSLTTALTAYPALNAPDVMHKSSHHEAEILYPPNRRNCEAVFDWLPEGTEPIPWSTLSAGGAPNVLPLKHTFGTCRIEFHASGKATREENFALEVAPDESRDMVGYVIDSLFTGDEEEMDFMTKHFNRTLDWLVAPGTGFPENLNMPVVQNAHDPLFASYEPGANDPFIGLEIEDVLNAAAKEAPDGSALKADLWARFL